MRIEIWHNLRWSHYKAAVFSAMARQAEARGDELKVIQITETDAARAVLAESGADQHSYPHDLLFAGSYDRIFKPRLWLEAGRRSLTSAADVTIIAGIDRPEYWVQALVLALRGRKRAVFCDSTAYDQPRHWLRQLAKRAFFKLVPDTLSYGERARSYVTSLGAAPERARLRCQAAFLSLGYDAATIADQRRAAALSVAAPYFLYVGRLAAEKDLETLLAAFARHHSHTAQARLRLIGAGPAEAALRAQIAVLGLDEAVELAAPRTLTVLAQDYLHATALVLPSRSEPWGLVVNEALHFGCPVIVSDRCGCVPELVQGNPAGAVFPCGDVDALAAALDGAAARWAADPAATAAACLARIAPFTPEQSARQTFAAIDAMLAPAQ